MSRCIVSYLQSQRSNNDEKLLYKKLFVLLFLQYHCCLLRTPILRNDKLYWKWSHRHKVNSNAVPGICRNFHLPHWSLIHFFKKFWQSSASQRIPAERGSGQSTTLLGCFQGIPSQGRPIYQYFGFFSQTNGLYLTLS